MRDAYQEQSQAALCEVYIHQLKTRCSFETASESKNMAAHTVPTWQSKI